MSDNSPLLQHVTPSSPFCRGSAVVWTSSPLASFSGSLPPLISIDPSHRTERDDVSAGGAYIPRALT